jgi:Protein of unknown function (DUF2849)
MAKKAALQIVTANHLTEGHSVFLTDDGWSANHHLAQVAGSAEDAAELEALGRKDEDGNLVVGVYLVEVALDDEGQLEPTHYREKMRVRARPSFWADETLHARAPKAARAFAEAAHVSL